MSGAAAVASSARTTAGGGGAFPVSLTTDLVTGLGTQTGIVTASASGGTAPYAYEWIYVAGDALDAQSPLSPSTRFEGTPPSAEVFVASFFCQATDDNGAVGMSETVSAQLTGI